MLEETKKLLAEHSNRIVASLSGRNVVALTQEYLELLDIKLNATARTIETRQMQEQTKAQLDQIKMKHIVDVANEVDADGKPVYSNDKKRQAEAETRIMNDADFHKTKQEFDETAIQLNEYSATIDMSAHMARIIEGTIKTIN